jgi:hypothetical protein
LIRVPQLINGRLDLLFPTDPPEAIQSTLPAEVVRWVKLKYVLKTEQRFVESL